MRLHDLTLETPDGTAAIEFHRDMTVITGLEDADRVELADGLLGAMAGGRHDSLLRYLATDGSRGAIQVRDGTISMLDLSGAPSGRSSIVGRVVDDRNHLRRLGFIGPDRLRPVDAHDPIEPDELVEARQRLVEVESELAEVDELTHRRAELRAEFARLRRLGERSAERAARAAWREATRRVEALAAELGAQDGGTAYEPGRAAADETLLDQRDAIEQALATWQALDERLSAIEDGDTTDIEIEPAERARLCHIPDVAPLDLDARLAELEQLEQAAREARRAYQRVASDQLPEPSDPLVTELARHDQEILWTLREQLCAATADVAEINGRLAGIGRGDNAGTVALMEEAHRQLVQAEDRRERHLVPGIAAASGCSIASMLCATASLPAALALLICGATIAVLAVVKPRIDAKAASLAEMAAARETGAPSYLAFHLRRLEASFDKELRNRLEAAELEHRLHLQNWVELTAGIDAELVGDFEVEVRRYASTIDRIEVRASELDAAGETADVATRNARVARGELVALCSAYAIDEPPLDDAVLVRRLFDAQITRRQLAERQVAAGIVRAERDEAAAELGVFGVLAGLDRSTPPHDCASLLQHALAEAAARDRTRRTARPQSIIEAELASARADAATKFVDGWDDDELESDLTDAEIDERIAQLSEAIADGDRRAAQAPRLDDRRRAMQRRITTLETSLGSSRRSQDADALADAERTLQAIFTAAGALGPDRERLPIVFDDAFAGAAAARKWDLLEVVRRLAEHNQVIYLTNDPYVTAWASTAAGDGRIALISATGTDTGIDTDTPTETPDDTVSRVDAGRS